MTVAILLVDPQYDFFPGGTLAVPEGDQIVEPINGLLRRFWSAPLFVSRDWHPPETRHFAARGGPWPAHCVQGTRGAAFHTGLKLGDRARVVTKGTNPEDDGGYSAFDGTIEGGPLRGALQSQTLIVAGLATDYCVKATVLDALRVGYQVLVYKPGIRAVNVNPGDGERALEEMRAAGALFLE